MRMHGDILSVSVRRKRKSIVIADAFAGCKRRPLGTIGFILHEAQRSLQAENGKCQVKACGSKDPVPTSCTAEHLRAARRLVGAEISSLLIFVQGNSKMKIHFVNVTRWNPRQKWSVAHCNNFFNLQQLNQGRLTEHCCYFSVTPL